jgi:hypothetical protein
VEQSSHTHTSILLLSNVCAAIDARQAGSHAAALCAGTITETAGAAVGEAAPAVVLRRLPKRRPSAADASGLGSLRIIIYSK